MTAIRTPLRRLSPRELSGRAEPDKGAVYLHPGEYAMSADPCVMTTILGSCVAVCLFDPVAMVGGMNHFLLPRAPEGVPSTRYGNVAVHRLLSCVLKLGAQPERLRAKVVGGACVLAAYQGGESHIGRENARAAIAALESRNVAVFAVDVGGDRARKVRFLPHTGDLVVRVI